MRGCFARWLSGERGEKRAVKHGKSGLRAAICALFGTLRGDLCKTVEKLCKSLQGVKTKITNCAQRFVRLCVLVRELCKYRFLSAFGVWALWCGGAPFGRFPSRLRRRGPHFGGGGGAVGGRGRGLPCALPSLHTVIRHTSGMVRHTSGFVRHCARVRPPLPSPSPTLRTAARDTVPQRRGLFSGAARTLPGSGRRANDILYIRVRRREGENVLHRAASNDVDNFSVDNPLWITAAAGCRLLCGGRGRRCGGSVNAGTEVQTRTGRVRKSSRAMGARRGRLSAPWLQFHGGGSADVYIIIRVRASRCGESALNPPTSPPIPRRRPAPAPRTATRPARALSLPHAAPTHTRRLRHAFLANLTTHSPPKTCSRLRTATRPSRALPLSPTQRRRMPADPTTHSPPKADALPRSTALPPPPFRFGHKKTAPHSACAMPNVSVDRRCGRSFGLVSRALFAAVAGRWRVGVGLRPQPWALRSRRCGRVLRA